MKLQVQYKITEKTVNFSNHHVIYKTVFKHALRIMALSHRNTSQLYFITQYKSYFIFKPVSFDKCVFMVKFQTVQHTGL
jgi:hypothetical protein